QRDEYFAQAPVTDHAFSTAGDYERTFMLNGKRYHHIIDPKTGYPANRSRSVTIWAPDATTADGLDDAVFILGPVDGMKLVESLPAVGAGLVAHHIGAPIPKTLKSLLKLIPPPTAAP